MQRQLFASSSSRHHLKHFLTLFLDANNPATFSGEVLGAQPPSSRGAPQAERKDEGREGRVGVWGQHAALTPVVLVLGQEAAGGGDGGHGSDSTENPTLSGRSLRGKGCAVPGERMRCTGGQEAPGAGSGAVPRPCGSPACPRESGRGEAGMWPRSAASTAGARPPFMGRGRRLPPPGGGGTGGTGVR